MLARRWRTGVTIWAVCVLGAAVVGWASTPLYRASTVFAVSIPAPSSAVPRGYHVFLHLDVPVLQSWLEDGALLERAIDAAGARGRVSAATLHRNAALLAGGSGVYTFTRAPDASPEDRRYLSAVAGAPLETVSGIYQISVLDASPERAQRLADALAATITARMVAAITADFGRAEAGVNDALRSAEAVVRARERDVAAATAAKDADATRSARARYAAALRVCEDLQTQEAELVVLLRGRPVETGTLSTGGTPVAPVTPGGQLYLLFGVVGGVVAGTVGSLIHESARTTGG